MIFKNLAENFSTKIKLNKMQYTQDQKGIARRFLREKEAWDNHFFNSKQFILKSAIEKKKSNLVVLGSGWLFDLPIDELASQFKNIRLIDIIHPKQIVKKVKKYSNVQLENADITGGLIDYFYKNASNRFVDTETISKFKFAIPESDFVISLNIMCQLHIILIDYIKKFDSYSSNHILELEKIIQTSHLSILPKNKTCLITDIEEEIYSEDNQLIGVNPLIRVDLPKGKFSNKWQWKFDSKMTYRENAKTYFNTLALDF